MGIGVGIALVWAGRHAIHAITARRAAAVADAAAQVTMEASAVACADAGNPIGLVVENRSNRTVKEITFSLEVKRADASTNLAIDSSNLRWTHVVQPGKQMTTCRAWPALASELSGQLAVTARINHVVFYEPGETVPSER